MEEKEYKIGEEYYLYQNGELLTEATWVDDKWNGLCFLAIPKREGADPRAVWVIWADDIDFAIKKERVIK
jgi:hypothetical protein